MVSNSTSPALRRTLTACTAMAATGAVIAGTALGQGQANAAVPQVTSAFQSLHESKTVAIDDLIAALGITSTGVLGGQALTLPALAELAGISEEQLNLVLELAGIKLGTGTAIALLPGAAIVLPIGADSSARALAILGIAAATDGIGDSLIGELLGVDDVVLCLGVVATANSKSAGSCANLAATFDYRYDNESGEVQFGFTNLASLVTLFTEPERLVTIGEDLASGQQIYLTKDYLRLSLNGAENIALTSDYGYTGAITVSWLGSNLVIFPGTAQAQGPNGPEYVNYLSLPQFQFATPTSPWQLIPTFNVPSYNVLDLFEIPGFDTADLFSGLTTSSVASASVPVSALTQEQPSLLRVGAGDDPTTTDQAESSTIPETPVTSDVPGPEKAPVSETPSQSVEVPSVDDSPEPSVDGDGDNDDDAEAPGDVPDSASTDDATADAEPTADAADDGDHSAEPSIPAE